MSQGRFFKAFLVLTGIFFAVAGPLSLGAQTLERWFANPVISESYGSLKAEILEAANELRQLSLSEDLLLSRLEEAARKTVSAPVLLAGIRADMDYIRRIVRSLTAKRLFPARSKDAVKAVQNALLLVRTGIGEAELETALDLASSRGGLKGKQSSILSRAFTALGVTASAKAAYGLSENSRFVLAKYLITSEMTEQKFDSVIARIAEKIKMGETADLAVSSLENSGNDEDESKKSAPGREKSKGTERPTKETGPGAGAGGGAASNHGGASSGQAGSATKSTPGKKNI